MAKSWSCAISRPAVKRLLPSISWDNAASGVSWDCAIACDGNASSISPARTAAAVAVSPLRSICRLDNFDSSLLLMVVSLFLVTLQYRGPEDGESWPDGELPDTQFSVLPRTMTLVSRQGFWRNSICRSPSLLITNCAAG